jgi:hypothetical protein
LCVIAAQAKPRRIGGEPAGGYLQPLNPLSVTRMKWPPGAAACLAEVLILRRPSRGDGGFDAGAKRWRHVTAEDAGSWRGRGCPGTDLGNGNRPRLFTTTSTIREPLQRPVESAG